MDVNASLLLAGSLGLVAGALVTLGVARRRGRTGADPDAALLGSSARTSDLPEGLGRVLAVLPGAAFVVDAGGVVRRSSAMTGALGVVVADRVAVPEIAALIGQVRRDGVIREQELELRRPPLGKAILEVRVRVAPLTASAVLVMVEDMSEARRLDAVRRDFVANVSHELKTPVGALSLLAEAVQSASDDPEAVQHFSARMQTEAARLSNLVNDLMDLSRLQGADSPPVYEPVPVSQVVSEAVDATRMAATAHEIEVVRGGDDVGWVTGDEGQLVMALRNLLTNAISYSPPRTKVAVATRLVPRREGDLVEISVTDQGIGIPEGEQARIFERFYRIDPARSRATGGTGLGLAIVKHVCANHGGECVLWSVEGEGSTFTLRLPSAVAALPSQASRASGGQEPRSAPSTTDAVGVRVVPVRQEEPIS